MSDNPLPKINKNTALQTLVILALIVLVAVNARLIIDNLLSSREIDEKIVAEANPRLNRKLIGEAKLMIDSFQRKDQLTSISPSDTLEKEALEPENLAEIIVEIQNASSVNGAAANTASLLTQKGYQISAISTAPAKQNKTVIFYKAGKTGAARTLRDFLISEDWPVEIQASNEIESDILIVLGK